MSLKKYNNLLTSGRWSKNNTKYAQIIYLVGVYQKISDESMKLYENYQQYNDLRLHLCQDQDQESHWYFVQNCTHWLANCMDPLTVKLDSRVQRGRPVPTKSQPPHIVLWNKQPRRNNNFWHFYMVHTLWLSIHSLRQPLFWSIHQVQNP